MQEKWNVGSEVGWSPDHMVTFLCALCPMQEEVCYDPVIRLNV
jgi:hypothetical protein